MQLPLHLSEASRHYALCMLLGKFNFSPLTLFPLPVSPLHREHSDNSFIFILYVYHSVLNICNNTDIIAYLTNSHFFNIYSNIFVTAKPGCCRWSQPFSFRPHPPTPVGVYLLRHTCYMSLPAHSPAFDILTNVWWEVQTLIEFSPVSCYLPPLRLTIFLRTLSLNTFNLHSSHNLRG